MKTETCKLYSRVFRIFLPNIIKIDPCNFELYSFKVGPFFETQCSISSRWPNAMTLAIYYTRVGYQYSGKRTWRQFRVNWVSYGITFNDITFISVAPARSAPSIVTNQNYQYITATWDTVHIYGLLYVWKSPSSNSFSGLLPFSRSFLSTAK